MDLIGLAFVAIFYLAILSGGIWIAKRKGALNPESWEELVLANRDLGLFVGIFTLIATEVGGAFVNGTAEEVYSRGVIWCLAPIGYALSMTINGLFFVPKLRAKNYVTLIDSLQNAFGQTLGGIVYFPSCFGDICWTAAVLSALGATLSVILVINMDLSLIISAIVAISYTLIGGMYSVAYTDVIQIVFIFAGLWLAIPFIWIQNQDEIQTLSVQDWSGTVQGQNWVQYIDTFLLIVLGGIPWQPYYQRALAMQSTQKARILSLLSTWGCFLFMIPPVIIGGVAKVMKVPENSTISFEDTPSLTLPITLATQCPYWVSILGLAAVSAAAMSSVDSSLLSGASYLTHNVYSGIIRRGKPSQREKVIVLRLAILLLGISSTLLSVLAGTIYGLWVMAGDLGYVIVFPQFFASVFFPGICHPLGSIIAATLSLILRVLIGEELVNLPAVIPTEDFLFPVKTLIMLISLFVLFAVSILANKFKLKSGLLSVFKKADSV